METTIEKDATLLREYALAVAKVPIPWLNNQYLEPTNTILQEIEKHLSEILRITK